MERLMKMLYPYIKASVMIIIDQLKSGQLKSILLYLYLIAFLHGTKIAR